MSKKHKDRKLEAVTTSELGYLFYISGSTVPGTHALLEGLKIAESTDDPQTLGIAYNNLAVTNTDPAKYKELSDKAFRFSMQAQDYYFVCIELGNIASCYLRPNYKNLDSALCYAEKGYRLAKAKNIEDVLVFELMTLARVNRELGNKGLMVEYIRIAEQVPIVKWSKDARSHIYNAYSNFYDITGQKDSAFAYAYKSLDCVRDAFLTQQSKPVNALRQLYRGVNNDSALKYSDWYYAIRDSLQKTEELQKSIAMRFEEDLRQEKMEEQRKHNLQYTAIAIGIAVFSILFLLLTHTVLASAGLIRFLGILSLLVVFEFVNLFIHPYLGELTHESPVIMLGFLVCLAALLIPLHHKLEHWVIHKLTEKNNTIRLAKAKKVIVQLEGKDNKAPEDKH